MFHDILSRLCIIIICMAFLFCSSPGKMQTSNKIYSADPYLNDLLKHRDEKHNEFLSEKSPLLPEDKKHFGGLNYYPIDQSYQVTAELSLTENPVIFKMKTTTARLPTYQKYGEVKFKLGGTEYTLEVYQSPDLMTKEGYQDYLFIPFTDMTNGKETYEVGRYLELRIPKEEKVLLDFNKCYNPYCSYNPNYSCPIPPEVNHLPIELKAGEKKYH